jgi:hypothetical protein
VKEAARMQQIQGGKTKEAKKERNKNKYLKLQEHTRVAKMEFLKRAGVYRKGMNMDDPFGELSNGREVDAVDARKPAAKRNNKDAGFCEYCGSSNHLTKRSKNCTAGLDSRKKFRRADGSPLIVGAPSNQATLEPVVATGVVGTDAAQDTDRLESLPFDHDLDSDDDSLAGLFQLVIGGAEDEDDDTVEVVRAVL